MPNAIRERRKRELMKTLQQSREFTQEQKAFMAVEYQGAPTFADQFRTQKSPTKQMLINEYRGVAYAAATLNAGAVAKTPMRLYVQTPKGAPEPKYWRYRKLDARREKWVRGRYKAAAGDAEIKEVLEHPMLDLIEGRTSYFGQYSLRELTDLYQELAGEAYWRIERGAMNVPTKIWLLQPQHITVVRDTETNIPMAFTYGKDKERETYPAEEIVDFRFPNLIDPYGAGWSPARAAYEAINIINKDHSFVASSMDNRARPDAIISPKDEGSSLTTSQAARLEAWLKRKFRQGGEGGVVVWESALEMKPLSFKARDMEMLARFGVTKTEVLNAYGVPPALMDSMKSRAELNAAQAQHGRQAIWPRLERQDERINQKLTTMFSDRLFVVSDDPVPEDVERKIKVRESNLKTGHTTINEERLADNKNEVEWGREPWLPTSVSQPSNRPDPSPPIGQVNEDGSISGPPKPGTTPPKEDEEDEEGTEDEKRAVLIFIRQNPEGVDNMKIAEELLIAVPKVAGIVKYWQKMGLIN